jgi:hypothetical protein
MVTIHIKNINPRNTLLLKPKAILWHISHIIYLSRRLIKINEFNIFIHPPTHTQGDPEMSARRDFFNVVN